MSTYREIYPEKPFDNAYFSRVADADNIDKLIENYKDEFVLSIISPWGNGKTWFLESYKRRLESKKYKVFKYNAWENELADNPFISFSGYIYSYLKNNDMVLSEEEKNTKLLDSMKNVAKYIIPVAVKLLIGTRIDIDQIGKIGDEAINSITDFTRNIYEEAVKKDDQIKTFRTTIEESIERVCSNSRPLIIIIDELDRCCPLYSVRFLETLKHFFNIRNVIYIIAIDKEMLCESIKHVYGQNIDPDGFLRKIINVQYY